MEHSKASQLVVDKSIYTRVTMDAKLRYIGKTVTGDLWAWINKVRSNSTVIFITFNFIRPTYLLCFVERNLHYPIEKTFTLVLPPRSYACILRPDPEYAELCILR